MKYIIIFAGMALAACSQEAAPTTPPAPVVQPAPPASKTAQAVMAPAVALPVVEEQAVIETWHKTYTVHYSPELVLTVEEHDYGVGEEYANYYGKIEDTHDSSKWTLFDIKHPQEKIWDAHLLAGIRPVLAEILAVAHNDYGKYPAAMVDKDSKHQCVTVTESQHP